MKIAKWIGIAFGALASLVVMAIAIVYFASQSRINREYSIPAESIAANPDDVLLARGGHIVQSVSGCVACHGPALGGKQMIDAPAFAIVAASNLTSGRGGVAARYDDAGWERAIRHGINSEGRSIAIMPSSHYNRLSDDDLRAVVAYIKSRPPIDNELKPFSAGPISRAITLAGAPFFHASNIAHDAPHQPSTPAPAADSGYGEYLVTIGACRDCHGPNLSGGLMPGESEGGKLAANITPTGLAAYNEAAFFTAMREGKRPGGVPIDTVMPWRQYRGMTDDELKSVWAYLRSVPPRPMGQRD